MSKRDTFFCDLCGMEIENYIPGGTKYIVGLGTHQEWPVGDKVYDVCPSCCVILWKAERLKIITLDTNILNERADFQLDEKTGVWRHRPR